MTIDHVTSLCVWPKRGQTGQSRPANPGGKQKKESTKCTADACAAIRLVKRVLPRLIGRTEKTNFTEGKKH